MVVPIAPALEKLRQEGDGLMATRITLRPFLKPKQNQAGVVACIFEHSMEELE